MIRRALRIAPAPTPDPTLSADMENMIKGQLDVCRAVYLTGGDVATLEARHTACKCHDRALVVTAGARGIDDEQAVNILIDDLKAPAEAINRQLLTGCGGRAYSGLGQTAGGVTYVTLVIS